MHHKDLKGATPILEHIQLEDFIGIDPGKPAKGSKWRRWFNGEEPRIDHLLAKNCLVGLWAAGLVFGNQPDKDKNATRAFTLSMQNCLVYVHERLMEMDEQLWWEPFAFKDKADEEEWLGKAFDDPLPFTLAQIFACYTIYFFDKAIGSLLTDNPAEGTRFVFYGATMAALQYHNKTSPENKKKIAAAKRHKENHMLEGEAKDYYRHHIYPTNPKISNEAAARLLGKRSPLKHRTLVQYVAEEKAAIQLSETAPRYNEQNGKHRIKRRRWPTKTSNNS